MNPLKAIWGLLFRLFPCPTRVGLHRVGNPGRQSPVLLTCNFYTTVRRLRRVLRRNGIDTWLLVADSKGVNVWCAACAEEFNTHSVISVLKTTDVGERVAHRRIVLPPLGAVGINPDEVREATGWSPSWGPVYAVDLPRYLAQNQRRDESMRRVVWDWRSRLDTALGSLFPFFLLGVLGFLAFARHLLVTYLVIGTVSFVGFMVAAPWLPGKRGLTKVLILDAVLAVVLFGSELLTPAASPLRGPLVIAMALLLVYGTELGGLAPTLGSDLDPFLARLGIGAVGNVALAGTVRTELLNGYRELRYDPALCNGCRRCFELCPQGVWRMDDKKAAVFARPEACTACRACLMRCMTHAISAPRVAAEAAAGGC